MSDMKFNDSQNVIDLNTKLEFSIIITAILGIIIV